MRRFVVLTLVLATGARDASANSCNALYPHVVTTQIPLGCPLVAYVNQELTGYEPTLRVLHAGQERELTGAIAVEQVTLPVYLETIDDQCVEHDGTADVPFDRLTFELPGVEVGDEIYLGYAGDNATMIAAGPCPTAEPPPYLYCQDPIQEYWACQQPPHDDVMPPDPHAGHDHGGCNAGGGLGVGLAGLLLGLRRRRATGSR